MQLVLSASFIALVFAIPFSPNNAADNVILHPDFQENPPNSEWINDTNLADDETGTIDSLPDAPCYSKDRVLLLFWEFCGYFHEGNSYVCKSYLGSCALGRLREGNDTEDEVCDSDNNCTENWFEGMKPPSSLK